MSLDPLAFVPQGLQVIEASAGTGKTWTLAALYVRLVLGDGRAPLEPRQILVMTFTEAAMEELRDRIRTRLAEAARVFHGNTAATDRADAFLRALLEQRRQVAVRQGQNADSALRSDALRLDTAARSMDEAAIFTLHAWSQRMLREHAFESTSLFEQRKVDDPQALLLQVTQDYWRQHVYPLPADQAAGFADCADSPRQLLRALRTRLQELEHQRTALQRPMADVFLKHLATRNAWHVQLTAATTQARALWKAQRSDIEAYFDKAYGTTLNGKVFQRQHFASQMARMARWCEGEPGELKDLQRYSASNQTAKSKPSGTAPPHHGGVYVLLDEVVQLTRQQRTQWRNVYAHAVQWISAELALRKLQRAQFDFPDLLQRLCDAVNQPDGRLAQLIRTQYPVALVDEFQDTDRLQYDTLKRIYAVSSGEAAPALVMIGDPKQAIYRFRGADLTVYLEARDDAGKERYSLSGNYRSSQALVNALNHVFTTANEPFRDITYETVAAMRASQVLPVPRPDGSVYPALTVWTLPEGSDTKANALYDAFARAVATQVVALLNAQSVAKPADIAVLVRTGREALWVRRALNEAKVPSVYLSERESVYASRQALELWYLLDAVQRPRNLQAVRAAVSTRLYGLTGAQREAVLADETLLEQHIDAFLQWQVLWQQQGVLAMLHAVLHDRGPALRLLGQLDGERALTNLLHLATLLQEASRSLQGERALLRYLGERIASDEHSDNGPDQLQLETDAELVKVVTLHKSKGLEYPVVFLPFAYGGRDYEVPKGEDKDSQEQVDERKEHENEALRLLYVGMTRAQRALFLGAATPAKNAAASALYKLLNRSKDVTLDQSLDQWRECPDIQVTELPQDPSPTWTGGARPVCTQRALTPGREHVSTWRSSSFTRMVRGLHEAASLPSTEADERREAHADGLTAEVTHETDGNLPSATDCPWAALKGGAVLGNAMHELLEWQLQHQWPLLQPALPPPAAWTQLLQRHVRTLKFDDSAAAVLSQWVQACGQQPLVLEGEAVTLGGLQPGQLWTEMPFVLQLNGTSKRRIDELLCQHVQPGAPRTPLRPETLAGQLVGSLDLVFEHQGRWYVLDHKTNALPQFTAEAMAATILGSRYDLQYALYLVALHRLLRTRVPNYDYDRHVGGALYLFLRGVGQPGSCLHRDRPPRECILALDRCFAGKSS